MSVLSGGTGGAARSFAFGNANIENPDVARETVDAAAEALKNKA